MALDFANFLDLDIIDNVFFIMRELRDGAGDIRVEAISKLLGTVLPRGISDVSRRLFPSQELDLGIDAIVERLNCPSGERVASECLAFVSGLSCPPTGKSAMSNITEMRQLVDAAKETSELSDEACWLISYLFEIIIPVDADAGTNKTLIENLGVALNFLDELENGLVISDACREHIRSLLSLVSPPAATQVKDTCTLCHSDEYGTYHRTGFKCLRCFGTRDSQEDNQPDGTANGHSRLALAKHADTRPQLKNLVDRMESIPSFVDTISKAHLRLYCNDSARFDQQGFEFSDAEREALLVFGLLDGRLLRQFDAFSGQTLVAKANCTASSSPMYLRDVIQGALPGKYLATRTEGLHYSLTESFRTSVRILSHPNLMYLFSLAVDSKPLPNGSFEYEVWYVHENLPLLVEHLHLEGQADAAPTGLVRTSIDLRFNGASGEGLENTKAVFFSVLSAANALHERGVVHGDFRPHNLFRDPKNSVVKVRFAPNYKKIAAPFCPPEIESCEDFMPTTSGDIYTLGVTLRLLVFGVSSGPPDLTHECAGKELCSFIDRMTNADPGLRPSASDLLKDPFLAAVRIAQGIPMACRVSSIAVGSVGSAACGATFQISGESRANSLALQKLFEFIKQKGADFQVIRKGDSLTLYSTKSDPRQQKPLVTAQ